MPSSLQRGHRISESVLTVCPVQCRLVRSGGDYERCLFRVSLFLLPFLILEHIGKRSFNQQFYIHCVFVLLAERELRQVDVKAISADCFLWTLEAFHTGMQICITWSKLQTRVNVEVELIVSISFFYPAFIYPSRRYFYFDNSKICWIQEFISNIACLSILISFKE